MISYIRQSISSVISERRPPMPFWVFIAFSTLSGGFGRHGRWSPRMPFGVLSTPEKLPKTFLSSRLCSTRRFPDTCPRTLLADHRGILHSFLDIPST